MLLLYILAQNIIILLWASVVQEELRRARHKPCWNKLTCLLAVHRPYLQIFSMLSTVSVAQTPQPYKRIGLNKISKSSS